MGYHAVSDTLVRRCERLARCSDRTRGQIDQQQTAYLQARGTKVVSYCCGPEYVHMMQAMIFGRQKRYSSTNVMIVWIIPQVVDTSASYFSVLRRQPVREVPFVWDPMCRRAVGSASAWREYRPTGQSKRLSIMEPNIDVTKFCLYPLLIAELGYRKFGEKISYVHATNTEHLAKQPRIYWHRAPPRPGERLKDKLCRLLQHPSISFGTYRHCNIPSIRKR